MPAAGAAADSHDQKGLVGDKGQVRNWRGGKSPCLEHRTAPCYLVCLTKNITYLIKLICLFTNTINTKTWLRNALLKI